MMINPFRTAVPLWGQTSQISSTLSPKRDCGSKGVKKINKMLPWYAVSRVYRRTMQCHVIYWTRGTHDIHILSMKQTNKRTKKMYDNVFGKISVGESFIVIRSAFEVLSGARLEKIVSRTFRCCLGIFFMTTSRCPGRLVFLRTY